MSGCDEPADPVRILRLLRRDILFAEALELLQMALAAEYSRGRADGTRDMGDRLVPPRATP